MIKFMSKCLSFSSDYEFAIITPVLLIIVPTLLESWQLPKFFEKIPEEDTFMEITFMDIHIYGHT